MKKVAVVTGGSKGIGRALVERFALNGYLVFTCARNLEVLSALKAELFSRGAEIKIMAADMAKKEDVLRFADLVSKEGGGVDVLVNNAGVFVQGQIHNEVEGVLEQLIDTNLYSAYYLTRALVPQMIKAGKGHVVNMCSTASITPYVNGGSYCISKYALYGMTKVLREELKSTGVKVVAILPGATYTASWEGVDLPEERFMPASDVANAVWEACHLSSSTVVEEILLRPQLGDI